MAVKDSALVNVADELRQLVLRGQLKLTVLVSNGHRKDWLLMESTQPLSH